jgi:hypothetical protein
MGEGDVQMGGWWGGQVGGGSQRLTPWAAAKLDPGSRATAATKQAVQRRRQAKPMCALTQPGLFLALQARSSGAASFPTCGPSCQSPCPGTWVARQSSPG